MSIRIRSRLLLSFVMGLVFCSCTKVKFEVGKRNEEKMLRNSGVVSALSENRIYPSVTPYLIKKVYGVHLDSTNKRPAVELTFEKTDRSSNDHRLGQFTAYDGVQIPIYEFTPPGFDPHEQYPVIILFSGHGDMDQLAFEKWTYQKGAAGILASSGYLVYVMENRGMGRLSNLGDHLKIDAVARLTGGSWYGELITDGLYLLEYTLNLPFVDADRVGVGGVSTGGALSMIVSAIDDRIKATYVQGYLGSFTTTFGIRANHDICNNIPGVLNYFDIPELAAVIAPRKALYVNGDRDTFYYQDAEKAFEHIKKVYTEAGKPKNVSLKIPKGTIHELSVDIMEEFFKESL